MKCKICSCQVLLRSSVLNGNLCPAGFHDLGDGRCYFYGYFKLNWFRAMEFCHSFGSDVSLACIETRIVNVD
jgi:hypothetical protein